MNLKAAGSGAFGAGAIAAMIYGIAQVGACQREGGYQQCKDEWAQAAPLIAGGAAAIVGLFMPQPKLPRGEHHEPTPPVRRRREEGEPPAYFPPLPPIEEVIPPAPADVAEESDVLERMDRAYRRLQSKRKA